MRIVLNGWFIDQPHTGSGQYMRQLLKQLPQVAPQHEYALVVPDRGSFKIHDITASTDLPSLISDLQRPRAASNFRKLLFEQSIMPRAARAYEADVLHVPYWAPPLRSSVPIVVTIHDIIPLILLPYRGGPWCAPTQLVSTAARATLISSSPSDIGGICEPTDRVRTIYLAAGRISGTGPDRHRRAAQNTTCPKNTCFTLVASMRARTSRRCCRFTPGRRMCWARVIRW
jgi:hypothetical protein